MDENNTLRRTKGDNNVVTSRLGQVHRLTIKLPYEIPSIEVFYSALAVSLTRHEFKSIDGEVIIKDLPVIDVLNIIVKVFAYCEEKEINYGTITALYGIIKSFPQLKSVSFRFLKGEAGNEIFEKYKIMLDPDRSAEASSIVSTIYNIDELVIRLIDLFPQYIIDDINKIMMFDGILENEYLKRQFNINFKYDEYCSYIEMIFKNNFALFEKYGEEVFNYMFLFPQVYTEQKPNIKMITNYGTL